MTITNPVPLYVIMYTNGKAENIKEGMTYYDILNKVYIEFCHAGTGQALPDMLFKNGKVIVKTGLTDIAWKYSKYYLVSKQKFEDDLKAEFPEPHGVFEEQQ